VQGEKKWGRRKFWFPRVRIVAELSIVVWWLNSHIRIIHQSKVHKRRGKGHTYGFTSWFKALNYF
jgi:hypothetical protein